MTISMYQATIPPLVHSLSNLVGILSKAYLKTITLEEIDGTERKEIKESGDEQSSSEQKQIRYSQPGYRFPGN